MIGVATLLLGIGIVAQPGLEVTAVTIISQIGSDIDGETADDQSGYSVAMSADGSRIAIGAPYNDDNGNDAGHVRIYTWDGTTWTQTGDDINGETADDQSGYSVAMSADGTRIAIGAIFNDDNGVDSGQVRLYTWNGTTWTQTGDDINGETAGDQSGYSVAMSADGTRIAIGARYNDVDSGNIVNDTGHVRIYSWDGTTWMQTGDDINGEAEDDRSGYSVAMAANGNRIAIGAIFNNNITGHVRIYTWDGTTWTQTGADINGEAEEDYSGSSVALSADGSRIAIGAPSNGDTGHVRIYTWDGTTWTQTGADINGEADGEYLGSSVAMSADGSRIAIGAIGNNDNGGNAGQVRIYIWNGTTWTQTGDDINGETTNDQSGYSVAMSADGSRIAIGALYNDDNGNDAGQVRVLGVQDSPDAPTITGQIGSDIDGETADDKSGYSVAMSADGTRIAIGAPYNDSNGDSAGHVRIYTWNGTTWTQTGADINGKAANDRSGWSVAMSADGSRIAIGAIGNDDNGNNAGQVRIYTWDGTTWTQTGDDINGKTANEMSGRSVAMSADGSRIAIGARDNDDNGGNAGQVRIYIWDGTTWTQTGDDINGETGDISGQSVAMSADGSRIAIGGPWNDKSSGAGQVRIYTWNGTTWMQTGADINGETADDNSGWSVAMSADGSRIAIGADGNDGNGDAAGHVRIYTWNGTTWTQTGDDINGETASNGSGWSVAMSADGSRIAIGAPYNDDNGDAAGQVRIYTWDGTTWTQTGADINGETAGDYSGYSVAMSADGSRIAIGAPGDEYSESDSAGQVRIYSVPAAPTAPTISSVIAANGSLTVAFTAGTDGGSPITNYKYSIDGTNYVALNPAATTSPFTISGLTNGTSYSVSIKAVNEIGDSIASNAVAGIPVAPTPTVTPAATVPVLETVKKADSLPKTGDNSSRVVMIGLLFTMTGLVLTSRRRIKQ